MVSRREDEHDRRSKRIAITVKGKMLIATLEQRRADAQIAVMEYYSAEDRPSSMGLWPFLPKLVRGGDAMTIQSPPPHNSDIQAEIVLPFSAINLSSLPIVGGKAANLGEMIHAGLPVPPGFCITTTAYTLVAEGSHIETLLEELSTTDANDAVRVAKIATALRTRLLEAPIPSHFEEVITDAYRRLGDGECVPVAVRSSATAEDLPYASFAGQQETYLNIVGIDTPRHSSLYATVRIALDGSRGKLSCQPRHRPAECAYRGRYSTHG